MIYMIKNQAILSQIIVNFVMQTVSQKSRCGLSGGACGHMESVY